MDSKGFIKKIVLIIFLIVVCTFAFGACSNEKAKKLELATLDSTLEWFKVNAQITEETYDDVYECLNPSQYFKNKNYDTYELKYNKTKAINGETYIILECVDENFIIDENDHGELTVTIFWKGPNSKAELYISYSSSTQSYTGYDEKTHYKGFSSSYDGMLYLSYVRATDKSLITIDDAQNGYSDYSGYFAYYINMQEQIKPIIFEQKIKIIEELNSFLKDNSIGYLYE